MKSRHPKIDSAFAVAVLLLAQGHAFSQARMQAPYEAPTHGRPPGASPLLVSPSKNSNSQADAADDQRFMSQDIGQSSTEGSAQHNEKIMQLRRLALGEAAPAGITSPAPKKDAARSTSKSSNINYSPGRASWLLGLIYLHGQGVPIDAAQAQTWFTRAWSQQERIASAGLAWCAMEGCTGSANLEMADQWLSKLKEINPGRALYLQWYLLSKLAPIDGPMSENSRKRSEADSLLKSALSLGDVQAHAAYGRYLFSQDRLADSLKAFERASHKSPAASHNADLIKARLALVSSQAEIKPNSVAEAEKAYQQARRLHRGEGIPANYTEAIRLYWLADRLGSSQSRKMLSLIYSRPLASGEIDINWMRQLADLDLTQTSPRVVHQSSVQILQEDLTPLMDLLDASWRM